MSDIVALFAKVLEGHGQLDDSAMCECGHWGGGHREGWEWHAARELISALRQSGHRPAQIPDGYAVHHVNGDPHDHTLDNLRLVKIAGRGS